MGVITFIFLCFLFLGVVILLLNKVFRISFSTITDYGFKLGLYGVLIMILYIGIINVFDILRADKFLKEENWGQEQTIRKLEEENIKLKNANHELENRIVDLEKEDERLAEEDRDIKSQRNNYLKLKEKTEKMEKVLTELGIGSKDLENRTIEQLVQIE